jgi:hypothetical protein
MPGNPNPIMNWRCDELIDWQILLARCGRVCYIGDVNGKLSLLLSSALLLRRAAVGL